MVWSMKRTAACLVDDLLDRVERGAVAGGPVHQQIVGVLRHRLHGQRGSGEGLQSFGKVALASVEGLHRLPHLADVYAGDAGDLSRLDRDQPLEHGLRVMLEREVHDRATGLGNGPHDLQGERRLAQPLRAGEQDQFARAEAAGEGGVEHVEAGRPDSAGGV
jgi:hypothetical protein